MKKIGVYIHIPFCIRKCPYCDFYSVKASQENIEKYSLTVTEKIQKWGEALNKSADTLYFGGGTPSCLSAKQLSAIANTAKNSFKIDDNAEITVEINPTISDFDFEYLRKNGFNRISVGVQSANDDELKILGRLHTSEQAKNCIEKIRKSGFENISLDLMIATPTQTNDSLERSIEFCARNNAQHISAYILKIEKGTKFYTLKDRLKLPNDDGQAEMYLFACEKLKEYGYNQYEISNFSKSGFESRHNLKYWNDDEYIGIGPSAHSFIDGKRFYYSRSMKDFADGNYIDDGIGGSEEEYIMLGLRLSKGINNREYAERFGHNIPDKYFLQAKKLMSAGYTEVTSDCIRLTTQGFIVSNSVILFILS